MAQRYRVICSQAVLTEFKGILEEADQQGLGNVLVDAAEQITNRLELEPSLVGEPRYNLTHLKLVVYVALLSPLCVHFAIDEERGVVYLKGFQFCPPR